MILKNQKIFFVILLMCCMTMGTGTCQETKGKSTYRGWYQFHQTVNEMADLQVQDRVNIIFALQESFAQKLPVDYSWSRDQVDGLRALILSGFADELPADKIADACGVLFDAYQLGAVHPDVFQFFDLVLTQQVSAETLSLLSKTSASLQAFSDEIQMALYNEILQNNWSAETIQIAVRYLHKAKSENLDLNMMLIGIVLTISQTSDTKNINHEMQLLFQDLRSEKYKNLKFITFSNSASKYRNAVLPDEFINNLVLDAVELDLGARDFEYMLNTISRGAKKSIPYEQLTTSIIIRLSQEKNSVPENICDEEYQFFSERYRVEKSSIQESVFANNLPFEDSPELDLPESSEINSRKMVEIINSFLGTPYCWGGVSQNCVDCSGLTQSIYRQCGFYLPRTSRNQFQAGKKIDRSDLQFGDLVFFDMKYYGNINHVGIYLGNNKFCHASSLKGVTITDLNKNYYQVRFRGGCRYW